MISAELFLAILQEKDLLPAEVIERLRKQIGRMKQPPTGANLAQQLIAEGHLTPALAKRLMEQASFTPLPRDRLTAAGEAADAAPGETPHALPEAAFLKAAAAEGFQAIPPAPAPSGGAKKGDEELGLAPLDDESSAVPGGGGKAKPQHAAPPQTPPAASPAPPTSSPSLFEQELPPLDDGAKPLEGLEQLSDDPLAGSLISGSSLSSSRPKKSGWRKALKNAVRGAFQRNKVVRVRKVNARQFTMTVLAWGIAVLLVIVGLICVAYLLPRSPEETWQKAQAAYQDSDYAAAAEQFASFATRFPRTRGPAKREWSWLFRGYAGRRRRTDRPRL